MYRFKQILLSSILTLFFQVNDTLESVFDESGDEEEQDAIVSQVLDEIGIEITGKVGSLHKTKLNKMRNEIVRLVVYFGSPILSHKC